MSLTVTCLIMSTAQLDMPHGNVSYQPINHFSPTTLITLSFTLLRANSRLTSGYIISWVDELHGVACPTIISPNNGSLTSDERPLSIFESHFKQRTRADTLSPPFDLPMKEVNYITALTYLCQTTPNSGQFYRDTRTHSYLFRAFDSPPLVPRILDRGLTPLSIWGFSHSRSSDSYLFFSEETWVVEARTKIIPVN